MVSTGAEASLKQAAAEVTRVFPWQAIGAKHGVAPPRCHASAIRAGVFMEYRYVGAWAAQARAKKSVAWHSQGWRKKQAAGERWTNKSRASVWQ